MGRDYIKNNYALAFGDICGACIHDDCSDCDPKYDNFMGIDPDKASYALHDSSPNSLRERECPNCNEIMLFGKTHEQLGDVPVKIAMYACENCYTTSAESI